MQFLKYALLSCLLAMSLAMPESYDNKEAASQPDNEPSSSENSSTPQKRGALGVASASVAVAPHAYQPTLAIGHGSPALAYAQPSLGYGHAGLGYGHAGPAFAYGHAAPAYAYGHAGPAIAYSHQPTVAVAAPAYGGYSLGYGTGYGGHGLGYGGHGLGYGGHGLGYGLGSGQVQYTTGYNVGYSLGYVPVKTVVKTYKNGRQHGY